MFFHLRDGRSLVSHSLSFSVLPPPPSSWCSLPLSSQVVAPPFSWYFVILPCFAPTCSPCWPFPCRAIWSRRGGGLCCAMMIKLLSAMVNVLDDNRIIDGNGHCHFRLHSPLMLVYLSHPPSCTWIRKLIFCSKAPPPKWMSFCLKSPPYPLQRYWVQLFRR